MILDKVGMATIADTAGTTGITAKIATLSTIALDKFSAEELNLMSIFDTDNREVLRADLITALHDVYEPDMIAVFGSTLEKLDTLTDEEFSELGFYIADDDVDLMADNDLATIGNDALNTEGDAFGE